MPLYLIVIVATLGAHIGDVTGFVFGKSLGPSLLSSKFMVKREKLIIRAQKFLDRTGSYTVILGRFVPAIRPLVPFLLGISDLKAVRFYIADVIACACWGIALGFLVTGVGSLIG
jgi:membrane protein DedA with SNARE-associated domain